MSLDKDVIEYRTNKLVIYAVSFCVCFVFLSLTTCTMHMNSYNPDEARGAAEEAKVDIEVARQKHSEEMARLKLVQELIDKQKVDPIAARCAVEGWTERTSDVCLELSKKEASQNDTETNRSN